MAALSIPPFFLNMRIYDNKVIAFVYILRLKKADLICGSRIPKIPFSLHGVGTTREELPKIGKEDLCERGGGGRSISNIPVSQKPTSQNLVAHTEQISNHLEQSINSLYRLHSVLEVATVDAEKP